MNVTSIDRAEPAERYFVEVARRVLDDYFEQLGADNPQSPKRNVVRYESGTWFAEVLYIPEDGPNYSPRLLIGCKEELYKDPRRNRVDIMHTVPEEKEERSYNIRWKYRNRHQLEEALEAVRDRILAVYTKPYFANEELLRALLEQRYEVIEAKWKDEIDDHNASVFREKAEKAFNAKKYASALRFYEQIPEPKRTNRDRARAKYAESHTR